MIRKLKFLFFIFVQVYSQTISVNSDTIHIDVAPGDSTVDNFTIYNTGTDTLDVSIKTSGFCADYYIRSFPYSHIGSTAGKPDDWPVNNGTSAGPDVAYSLNLADSMTIDITLCHPQTNFDTRLEIFTADLECVPTTTNYSNDDDNSNCVDFDTVAVYAPSGIWGATLVPGQYYIVVDGYNHTSGSAPTEGEYKISVTETTDNDEIAYNNVDQQERLNNLIQYYNNVGKDVGSINLESYVNNSFPVDEQQNNRDVLGDMITLSPLDTIVLPDSSQDISIYIDVADGDSGGVYTFPVLVTSNDSINPDINLEIQIDVADIFPPGVPQNITAAVNARDISIQWDSAPGTPSMYKIFRGTDISNITLTDSVSGDPLQTYYLDFTIQAEQLYFYQISSVDMAGNESERSSSVSAMIKNSLMITEIMNNPNASSDEEGEWFEIYNDGTTMLNLIGWKIVSGVSEQYVFAEEFSINPEEYKVLGVNNDTSSNGGIDIAHQYNSISLDDTEDAIVLMNHIGETQDSVGWDNGATFPQGSGSSMSLLGLDLDNGIGTNWALSEMPIGNGDFGTPGSPNYYSLITLSQDTVFFDSLAVGIASMKQIAVSNSGNSALQIDTVFSDNESFSALYPDTSIILGSYIDVWFSPSDTGQINGSLYIISNSQESAEIIVHLFGSGYVDSLAPAAPVGFAGTFSNNTALFTWTENPEDDIDYYIIDKSNQINFVENQFIRFTSENTLFIDTTFTVDQVAYYRLCAVDLVGNNGDFSETIQITVLNTEYGLSIPNQYALHQNYPNPFNPTTTISYQTIEAGDVVVEIFNILGNSVRKYLISSQQAGHHSIMWTGRNDKNKFTGAGVYFYSLTVNGFCETRKMVLLK